MKVVRRWVERIQRFGNRWWYAPLVGFLALIDHFVIVIPTDGLLVTAVMMAPRRWIYTAAMVTIGSSIGAAILAYIIMHYGDTIVWSLFPNIHDSKAWLWTDKLMDSYGIWAIFLVALSPLMQHPAIIIGALAEIPLLELFSAVFFGRAVKYAFLAWVSSHSPKLLEDLWGIRGELEEVLEKGKPAVKQPPRKKK